MYYTNFQSFNEKAFKKEPHRNGNSKREKTLYGNYNQFITKCQNVSMANLNARQKPSIGLAVQ